MEKIAREQSAARVLVRWKAGDQRLGIFKGSHIGEPGLSAENGSCNTETRIPVAKANSLLDAEAGDEIRDAEMKFIRAVLGIDCNDSRRSFSILRGVASRGYVDRTNSL